MNATDTNDINVCRARPFRDENTRAAVLAMRKSHAFSFVSGGTVTVPISPIDAYAVAFGVEPDARISERVQQLFTNEITRIIESKLPSEIEPGDRELPYGDATGYIYILKDLGDTDANILKIGRTRQTPDQRLAQWRAELAPERDGRASIVLISAFETIANRFAEHVVHEILSCHRIANRINPVTNHQLTEFFLIENVMAAMLFLREVARFINAFCAHWRDVRRRRRTAPSIRSQPTQMRRINNVTNV